MGLLDQVSADAGGLWTSYGPMLPLTQYTEQIQLFNAMNFNVNVYDRENTTINATGLAILWCPSDPGVRYRPIPTPVATISSAFGGTAYPES